MKKLLEISTLKAYGAVCRCSPSEPLQSSFSSNILHLLLFQYSPPIPSAPNSNKYSPNTKKKKEKKKKKGEKEVMYN